MPALIPLIGNIGMPELLIIMVVVLLVFGAKRLPEIGQSMGKGIREFKKSLREVKESVEEPDEPESLPPRRFEAPEAREREREPKKLSE